MPGKVLLDAAEGVDHATAATLRNPGPGAWLALSCRARLQDGQTVLVLDATDAIGTIAVQAAKVAHPRGHPSSPSPRTSVPVTRTHPPLT